MRKFVVFLTSAVILIGAIAFLNIEVTSRQGYDYEVRTIKLPLYLKILDFMDRHYNYKVLAKSITAEAKTDEERTMKIFEWTYNNIKKKPKELPVVDDHAWYIIVRGYGVGDQFQDVFTTLCNASGIDAFFRKVRSKDKKNARTLSFIRLKNRWCVFDAYSGVFFKNGKNEFASIDDLKSGNWKAVSISDEKISDDYAGIAEGLNYFNYDDWKVSRAAIQSPVRRVLYLIDKKR